MKVKLLPFVLLLLLFITSGNVFSQSPSPAKPVMSAIKIDKPIELTGKLDDPAWARAVPVELEFEITPGDNIPAPQKTTARVLYTNNTLYFGFQCFDTMPDKIRANISDRDNMFNDDWVLICLDTYNDSQRYYELAVNPFGIIGDLMATGDNEDSSFDMIWSAAAERNEKGWTAVMAIPFSSLNFPNSNEQNWSIEIIRTIPRASRTQTSWTRVDRNIPSLMTQAGILKGIKDISAGGHIELLPYVMGQEKGALNNYSNPNSGMKFDKVDGRIGGSIKYSPSPNFTVDAVINPDFSQIETDAAQISVNTTFALYYDEKRPFFLAGRELIPSTMYYSRSINDPLYAGRIIGKSGGLTYLYMGSYDRNTVFVIPGEDNSSTIPTEKKSFANIGRLRYDFGDESFLGGMLFSRNFDEGHNYVFGFDWRYKFWGNWYFTGEAYLSQTKEMNNTTIFDSQRQFGTTGYNAGFNGESYTGNAATIGLSHSARAYNFFVGYSDYSPTYQTYNGLVTSNNNRQIQMQHVYIFYPENSFLDRGNIFITSYLRFNYDGRKKEQVVSPGFNLTLKGQTSLNASYLLVNDEYFYNTQLTGVNRLQVNLSSRPINEIALSLSGQVGNFIYRSSNPVIGQGHTLYVTLGFKPTSRLNITFGYSRAQLSNKATDALYYDGNIYRMVGIYQFTPEMMFRTIVQYDSFEKSFQLYPLFSYKLNAFTTFFIGATSNYLNYQDEFGFRNTDQQYFVKLQYLLGI